MRDLGKPGCGRECARVCMQWCEDVCMHWKVKEFACSVFFIILRIKADVPLNPAPPMGPPRGLDVWGDSDVHREAGTRARGRQRLPTLNVQPHPLGIWSGVGPRILPS